jgi:hypothetical protein
MTNSRSCPTLRTAATGLVAASALLLGACGEDTTGPERDAEVEDVQEQPPDVSLPSSALPTVTVEPGMFDTDVADVGNSVGQEVTLTAYVNDVIAPKAFTILGTKDTTADELLVLHQQDAPALTPGSAVRVTGAVRPEFSVQAAEQFVETDLDDAVLTAWQGHNYIEANAINMP